MPVMYFEMDDQAVVIRVNDFGARQLGYAPEEILGQSVLDVFHEQDQATVQEQFQSLIRTEGVASWEFRKRKKGGEILWVRETARAIRGAEGRLVVMVVCQDITERKRIEEERREAEEMVRQLSSQLGEAQEKERRRIAVHLHEDVGQNLALVHMRLAKLAPADEDRRREVREIQKLLHSAIVDTRTLTFELASPVLYELGLSEALRDLCERETEGTRFQFDASDASPDLPERIAVSFYRIASELIFNIRKHAEAGHAWVSLEVTDEHVSMVVKDDGKGFDPRTRREVSPSGIGLFSIEQRVGFHEGELDIQSTPGVGTRITVSIPIEKSGTP